MTHEIPQASGQDVLNPLAARHRLVKLLIALACGVGVAGVAVCATCTGESDTFFGGRQRWTHSQLDPYLPHWLRQYREEKGEFPARLADLNTAATAPDGLGLERISIADGWGRDFLYERPAPDSFVLRSLGRDGAPGGVGLDYDGVATEEGLQWDRELARPTWRQFLFELPTRGVLHACGASGLLAAGLTWLTIRKALFTAANVGAIVLAIAGIAGASVVLAGIMALHHFDIGPFQAYH